jgi:hypothetical protein
MGCSPPLESCQEEFAHPDWNQNKRDGVVRAICLGERCFDSDFTVEQAACRHENHCKESGYASESVAKHPIRPSTGQFAPQLKGLAAQSETGGPAARPCGKM